MALLSTSLGGYIHLELNHRETIDEVLYWSYRAGLVGYIETTDQIPINIGTIGLAGFIDCPDSRRIPPIGVHNPDYPLVMTPVFRNKTDQLGQNEQRVALDNEVLYLFKLRWSHLTPDEYAKLLNQFESCIGSGKPFVFIHTLTGVHHYCRHTKDSQEFELFAHNLYNLNEVEFIEVKGDDVTTYIQEIS